MTLPFRPLALALPLLLAVTTAVAEGPEKFTPVDTSKLLGSPDPLPLEAVVAFPKLKFERPVELTFPQDGTDRLFVLEQKGVIRVFENERDVAEATVFLDVTDRVSRAGNEEGLLGLAFHPEYRENGRFFVYYSAADPRRSVISEFRVSKEDAGKADRDGERVLMEIPQPFGNHNGGSIRFGPDGHLYIGLGDGGLAHDPHGNGQDLSTLLGSVLRIDVDEKQAPLEYAIPEDNPFVDRDEARGEIWAYGFRNVWRLSFDTDTGDLWCGDVGQERWEEIDRVVRGGNYGWKIREGRHPFAPDAPQTGEELIDPVAEYFHSEGVSVTGGLVYRGQRLPETYRGRYFFGDYRSGFVWTLRRNPEGGEGEPADEWLMDKVAETGLEIAAFGHDRNGEMYLCAFDGRIHQLQSREIDVEAVADAFPKTLSETGLFASVKDHELVEGVLPYDVNVPFWSDGGRKKRWVAFPKGDSVTFHEREKWEFPVGTVFVKTFLLALDQSQPEHDDYRRLETRLFLRGRDGWAGYTYVWNDEQTEAELIEGVLREDFTVKTADGRRTQTWHYPSRVQCMACHSEALDFVLGWNTRQMNREQRYPGHGTANQIAALEQLGVFENDVPQEPEELEEYPAWTTRLTHDGRPPEGADLSRYVRAWLDVNCTLCHHPDGIAGKVAGKPIDLRYHTPLEKTGIVGREPEQGQLSPPGSAVLAPGQPERSELVHRISERKIESRQMPPLATLREDDEAIRVIRAWIESLPPTAGYE